MTTYERLRAMFTDEQARALVDADLDVVGFVPLGWAALPIDDHLERIGGSSR